MTPEDITTLAVGAWLLGFYAGLVVQDWIRNGGLARWDR